MKPRTELLLALCGAWLVLAIANLFIAFQRAFAEEAIAELDAVAGDGCQDLDCLIHHPETAFKRAAERSAALPVPRVELAAEEARQRAAAPVDAARAEGGGA